MDSLTVINTKTVFFSNFFLPNPKILTIFFDKNDRKVLLFLTFLTKNFDFFFTLPKILTFFDRSKFGCPSD